MCYLALNIDSSAAFDRRKPARGFRRWKALPEIKETVIFIRSRDFSRWSLVFSARISLIFLYTNITMLCTIV